MRLLLLQLLIAALLGFLYLYLGVAYFYLYWWWDILLHILGGIWVGLAFAWLQMLRGKQATVLQCAVAALVIGIGWEIFEYEFDLGGSAFMSYPLDTAKDLLDDVLGGTLAGLIARKIL